MKRAGLLVAVLVSPLLAAATVLAVATPVVALQPSHASAAALRGPRADRRVASSVDEARAIARKFGHPVVVDSETTPTMQVSVMPDESMQLQSDSLPVRVKKANSWIAVDPTLVSHDGSWLTPRAAASPVRFSIGGTGDLAQVRTSSGSWLSESWPHGDLPAPKVSGATATYANVFPGVDLRLTATAGGMSEVLVIKSAAAAANPDLATVQLTMSGATLKTDTNRSLTARAPDGSSVAASNPTWWDSSGRGSNAAGPAGDESPKPLAHSVKDSTVSLDVAAVAKSSHVRYPVFVDPDWSTGVQAYWFTDRAYPNQSYLNGQYADGIQSVGNGGGYLSRAFWQFGVSPIMHKHVLGATFNVTELYSNTCSGRDIQAWHYGTGTPGFTWNTDPGYWNSLQDTKNLSAGSSCSAPAAVGFNVAGAANWAANYPYPTLQIGLRAADENDSLTRRHFSQGATLTVSYNTPPNNPASPKFTTPERSCGSQSNPVYINGTQPTTLWVNETDPDVGTNVNIAFYVVDANNLTTQKWTGGRAQGAQGPATVTIPANTLPSGTYAWHARAGDWIDLSPGYSPWCYFVVDDLSPAPPSVDVTSTATLVGDKPQLNAKTVSVSTPVGAPMTVDLSSQATDHAAGFVLWWVPTAATATNPTPPVPTANYVDALPTTGTGTDGAQYVSADANGAATVTVAPVDKVSTLWVASYDRAGNFSKNPTVTGSVATGLEVQISPGADNQSITDGHSWLPDTVGVNTVPDSGPGNLSLTVGAGTTWDESGDGDPAFHLPGLVTLGRYYGTMYASAVNGDAPAGSHFEKTIGQMLPYVKGSQPAGTIVVYQCRNGNAVMTSTSATCEGQGLTAVPVGYIWPTSAAAVAAVPGSTARLIYRCHLSTDHFDSTDPNCEGQSYDGTLGYFPMVGPNYTVPTAVDTTKSFTVSASVKPAASESTTAIYTAVSQSGTTNVGFAGFALQETAGKWRFCMRPQPTGQPTCVIGPDVDTSTFTTVTGIWDAVNDQLRIRTQDPYSLATAYYHPPTSNTTAGGSLMVGSEMTNSSASNQWSGSITDVTIYQGVLDHTQLDNLPNP